jgi:hypothetical protein
MIPSLGSGIFRIIGVLDVCDFSITPWPRPD